MFICDKKVNMKLSFSPTLMCNVVEYFIITLLRRVKLIRCAVLTQTAGSTFPDPGDGKIVPVVDLSGCSK